MTPLRVDVDLRANTLRIWIRDERAENWVQAEALIDVGEQGALLAIEIVAPAPLSLGVDIVPSQGGIARTARTPVVVGVDARDEPVAIEVSRRGAGFEISYPSGNQ